MRGPRATSANHSSSGHLLPSARAGASPSACAGSAAASLAIALALLLGLANPAASGPGQPVLPELLAVRTGTLHFPPPGVMIVALGVEYLPEVTNDLAGVRGALLRVPTLGLRLGLADQAEFQVSWPAWNRLRVDEQTEPPPLGRRLGRVSTDFGDVTVATLIRLRAEQGGWPACGLRFAAELPTSNELLGIGDNTTDVFASVLLGRSLGGRAEAHADLGVGILTERTRAFAQNDVLTYGVLAEWRAGERLHLIGEIAGHWSTRGNLPGTGSRGEARAGLDLRRGAFHWTALALHGVTGESRGPGISLNVSTRLTVLRVAGVDR